MLQALIQDTKNAIDARLASARSIVFVAVFGAIATFFFTVAAFLWAQSQLGSIRASLALGIAYAIFCGAAYLRARRRVRRSTGTRPAEEASPAGVDPFVAPALISTGVDVLRKVGVNRLVPAFALSAIAIALLHFRDEADKNKS